MRLRYRIAASPLGGLVCRAAGLRHLGNDGLLKVLIYHDVPSSRLAAFEAQVRFIGQRYGFLAPEDLRDVLSGKRTFSGTKVLLTFDDGFHSNAVVAERVLDPLGIKALFFIPPGFIDAKTRDAQRTFIAENIFRGGLGEPISDEMRPMSWQNLKDLVAQGHTIGAHTVNHVKLAEVRDESRRRCEIVDSGDILQQRLAVAVNHFAYPFGGIDAIDERAKAVIRERFAYCHSGLRGVNSYGTDRHSILRDAVQLADPLPYLRMIVEDALGPMYRKRAMSLERY